MGRRPKIIPHIPGTLEQIADAIFAKDTIHTQAKKAKGQKRKTRFAK